DAVWQDSVVQVRVYDEDDKLINQGTGFLVDDNGFYVASAHIVDSGVRWRVRDVAARSHEVVLEGVDAAQDMAVLRLSSGQPAAGLTPLIFSARPAATDATVDLAGYWHAQPEDERRSLFGSSKRPRFIASIVDQRTERKALTSGSPTDSQALIVSIGRGGYGSPVVNRCGQLLGLVRPASGMSDKELNRVHRPVDVRLTQAGAIDALLAAHGGEVKTAAAPCLTALEEEQAQAEAEAQARDAEIADEREKAASAKERASSAEAEAASEKAAREAAEQAKESAAAENSDKSEILEEVNQQLGTTNAAMREMQTENDLLEYWVYGAVAVGVLALLILALKRRADLGKAAVDLEVAQQAFADCRFEGISADGAPLAFFALGKDLLQREGGLTIGRSPELSQLLVADDTVSRQHARLAVQDNRLTIRDLGSTGGTLVNGTPIGTDPVIIISGDSVQLGEARLNLSIAGGGV
ncbi:MAG: FHA domain-containing protein, partial [Pseudomonadota bacterium]